MIRNIKALGLALVAAAAVASAAQASELHVTTAENKAIVTGEEKTGGNNVFQITPAAGPQVRCTQVTFEGTISQGTPDQQLTVKELTLTPTFSSCQAFGLGAQVKANGCKYTITGEHQPFGGQTVTAGGVNGKTSYVDITACTAGKQIEAIAPGCTIKVPEQSTLSHLVLTNVGNQDPSKEDVNVQITISGIQYQVSGALCGHTNNVTTADGTYTGQVTFRAFKDEGAEQVTLHGHQYSKLKDGAQLGLVAT